MHSNYVKLVLFNKMEMSQIFLVSFLLFLKLFQVSTTPIHINEDFLINPKIVGGEASPKEFPWLVSLQWAEGHFCGGVIISPNVILTSAVCVKMSNQFNMDIYAGLHNLSDTTGAEGVQMRKPTSLISYPQYPSGPNEYGNDIALVKWAVKDAFIFDEFVNAIPLPEPGQMSTGQGVIAGWGSAKEEEIRLSNVLNKAQVSFVSDEECTQVHGEDFEGGTMLCASGGDTGADFCNGDLGGPIIAENADGSKYVAGIASWGKGCGEPGFPGVYTKVSAFLEFINSNL